MDFTYFSVLPTFYNPYGVAPLTVSGSVTYNGTPQTGGGTNVATYSMTANEVLNAILIAVFNEFGVGYVRSAAIETNVAEIEVDLGEILAQIAALASSQINYDGGAQSKYATGAFINAAFTGINTKFTSVDAAIAAIVAGVSQTTLNNTIKEFVTDYVIGIAKTGQSGLTATLASGTAVIGGQYTAFAGVTTASLQPTRDNYVYLKNDGTLTYKNVAISAGAPSVDAGTIVLFKLTTDGASITASTDLRNLYPFTISQFSGLYANNSIPFAARIVAQWAAYLLPATATIGKVLASNGTGYAEGTVLTVDQADARLGVNNTSPATTLDVGGTIRLGDDSTNLEGSIKYTSGVVQRRDGVGFSTLATKTSELSDVSYSSLAANDALYFNGSNVTNKNPNLIPEPVRLPTFNGVVNVGLTDRYVGVDVSGSAVVLNLPDATTNAGLTYQISVATSDVSVHNITVQAVGGANVKGAPTFTMNTVNKDLIVTSNGTFYTGIYA